MKKLLSLLGSSMLAAAMLYGALLVALVVRAGVACSVPFIFVNGQTADATQVNANFNALVNCFSSAAAAGANSDITSLAALTTPISSGQGGTQRFFGTASGTNTIVVTTTIPASGFSKVAGVQVCFLPAGTNTAAASTPTLNVNGSGASNLFRRVYSSSGMGLGSLVGGELVATYPVCATFAGAAYVLDGRIDRVGEIVNFGYAGCPTGWQEANGSAINTTNFPDITSAYGSTWQSGTNFPDLRGSATFSRDVGGSTRLSDLGGGGTVGSTSYVQHVSIGQTNLPSGALAGSTATLSVGNSITGHIATSNGTFTGTTVSPAGGTSVPNCNGTCSDGGNGYSPGQSVTTGTINLNGGGNPVTILPNLGIVTKCVKL